MDDRFKKQREDQNTKNLSLVWTTDKVDQLMIDIDNGVNVKTTPFWDSKPEWRAANIVFEYAPDELDIIRKCSEDVIYFANNFCFSMTDAGVQKILLRDYQEDMLRDLQENRLSVVMMARQSGKTIIVGIFLVWYLLFNFDKNLMVLSNTGSTTVEIIDKIKVIISNLPFFLKPGLILNNLMTMKFDNGCRLFGRNTTVKAGVGFAIHYCMLDEFAFFPSNFVDKFWQTIFPTLSSSKISRMTVVSTPNGMNKFYDVYNGALHGLNDFKPIRIDWWQVPGRDEEWMNREIANLGSEEAFNQEYGLQFLSSSKLLLDRTTLEQTKKHTVEFVWRELTDLHNKDLNYEHLTWHPKFNFDNIKPDDKFAFTIDTAGGGGGDYTVLNIFKMVPMPEKMIAVQTLANDEGDFMSLLQVGIFRSNTTGVEDLQPILETLIYDVFGEDNVKITLEMDFKGNLLYERMTHHPKFYEEMFVHTKHSENAKRMSPGIKLNQKNKYEFCMEMRRLIRTGRIIPTEKVTFNELMSFGLDKKGSYSSQIGHDDSAMTIVNLVPFFTSDQYYEIVENLYDTLDQRYKTLISNKLNNTSDEPKKTYDIDFLSGLME